MCGFDSGLLWVYIGLLGVFQFDVGWMFGACGVVFWKKHGVFVSDRLWKCEYF
jgi:hypothetical protein